MITIIAEGVAIGHTKYHIFEAYKYAFVERLLASLARSRILANKSVKAFYSIEYMYNYNQSNINNGSDRPSSSPYMYK